MPDFILIFILIGVAHWAAHVLLCDGCKSSLLGILEFTLEIAVRVFGWPITAIKYFSDLHRREQGNVIVKGILSKREDETNEQFAERAHSEIKARIEAVMKERAENESANSSSP